MWLDNLKIKAISWSTQSSDPLSKKIPSNIIIGLIGITAALIEGLSYLSPTRVNHTVTPQASVDLRTRSVAAEIFGLLSSDDAIAKIKFASISKELPILDGKKTEQTLSQDDFSSTKPPQDHRNIPRLQEFMQQFPGLTTAEEVLSHFKLLEDQKSNLLEDIQALTTNLETTTGNEQIDIRGQIADLNNQLTDLNKKIDTFNKAFIQPQPLDFFKIEDLLEDSLTDDERNQVTGWVYEKTGGLDGFSIDWLKSQEDCPEKKRLLNMIDDFAYHPTKRLERLKLEQEAVAAFEAFAKSCDLHTLSLENIRTFELADPQNHQKFTPILRKHALQNCLSECLKDSDRRPNLTIELDNGPDKTPTVLKSLAHAKEPTTQPGDPLKDFPALFMYRQFAAIREHIVTNSGKSKQEAESIATSTLFLGSQSFDFSELTANHKLIKSFVTTFDAKKEHYGLASSSIETLFDNQVPEHCQESLGKEIYKFKIKTDGTVISSIEKPISTTFFLRAFTYIKVPTSIKIESTFNGSSIKQTLQARCVDTSNISITRGPPTALNGYATYLETSE